MAIGHELHEQVEILRAKRFYPGLEADVRERGASFELPGGGPEDNAPQVVRQHHKPLHVESTQVSTREVVLESLTWQVRSHDGKEVRSRVV